MSKSKHTPGPWTVKQTNRGSEILMPHDHTSTGLHYGATVHLSTNDQNNAARIVECVNALEGLDPSAIRELLEAARVNVGLCTCAVADGLEWNHEADCEYTDTASVDAKDRLRSALAKIQGESR